MKTLKDVAGLYKTLAANNLLQGSTRAYKTGNLYRSINDFNTPDKMISKQGNKSSITLNYAPPEAVYGGFVEKGTSKMRARPFAGNAADDPTLAEAIKEYQKSQVDEINATIYKRLTVVLAPLGKNK
jgi:HK97 gp10 family phage protein